MTKRQSTMASVREVYLVGNIKAGTIIRAAVMSYLLFVQSTQVASLLYGRGNVRKVNSSRKLSETSLHIRKSLPEEPGSRLWNTSSNINISNGDATFTEPQVMDKPGIFFPDDINPWTSWSACSGDTQTRTRGPPEYAKQMRCGHLECVQTRSCRLTPVMRSLQWGGWGQWSDCAPEGGRVTMKTRVRQCDGQSERPDSLSNRAQSNLPTSLNCIGPAYETTPCEVQTRQAGRPEWMNWSPWSSCDERGRQFRTRNCQLANQCTGARYETQACFLQSVNLADRAWFLCSSPSQYNARYCGGLPSNNGYQRVRTSQQRLWQT